MLIPLLDFLNPLKRLERKVMTDIEILRQRITELKAASEVEREQVREGLQVLFNQIVDLTAKLEGVTQVSLSAEITAIEAAIVAVQGIYTPQPADTSAE